MWKDYSESYIKNNRASSMSVMVAAFIASLFLSFLCSLFYNFWQDNIARIIQEEGGWEGRISGKISEEALTKIRNFANVKDVVVNEELSEGQEIVADLYFRNLRSIHEDMLLIVDALGFPEEAADYHFQLLSMYFVRIPGDVMPRLLMPAYLAVIIIVCISMILVIHNSFALSMNSRIHQFGIFSSIGATPGQIRACLMQEAAALALAPALIGILTGIVLSFGAVIAMNVIAVNIVGGRNASFRYHPAILGITLVAVVFTVLFSAWIPARKLSKMTPLEAIRGTGELHLKKKKSSLILSALFGMEGELAGNAWKAQKKALRTTSLSLTLSFLGFMLIQCFFTLSDISTEHTYFYKYRNAWDVMVTVKDTGIEEFAPIGEIQELPGVQSAVVYQKGEALCMLPGEGISSELQTLGGMETAASDSWASVVEGGFLVNAPIIILDDAGFEEYCGQLGISPRLDGTIVLNRFWDSQHSNFRNRSYVPYVREDLETVTLQNMKNREGGVEIPVIAAIQECPVLREEYGDINYAALVQFLPLSMWEQIAGQIGGMEKNTYIRVLAENRTELSVLNTLEGEISRTVGREYEIESENRIQEKLSNDEIIRGYKLILGAFCVLLAIIGIANVFSNTLGFLRQRKREFARYMSVGLTPGGIRKMFCIEAMITAGRPLLITLLVTIVLTGIMIRASYLEPVEFLVRAPVAPILGFVLAVFGFVLLAYYLGGRKVLQTELAEALRNDTMV